MPARLLLPVALVLVAVGVWLAVTGPPGEVRLDRDVGRSAGSATGATGATVDLAAAASPGVRGERGGASIDGSSTEPPTTDVAPRHASIDALRGVVRRASDGTPVAGLDLMVDFGRNVERVRTDAEGRYATSGPARTGVIEFRHRRTAPDGDYPLRLRLTPASATVEGPDAVHDLTLVDPAAVLCVRVEDRRGAVEVGATVHVETMYPGRGDASIHDLDQMSTDEAGVARFALYALEGLEALGVSARVGEPWESPTRVSALHLLPLPLVPRALESDVVVVVEEPASLLVRVSDLEGRPVAGVEVGMDDDVHALAWPITPRVHTDERGEATAPGLIAGRYLVWLPAHADGGGASQSVDLAMGERAELAFRIEASRKELAVSGRVVDTAGAPVERARVSVRAVGVDDGWRETVTSDPEGRFEVHAPRVESVRVAPAGGVFDDDLEPLEQVVPFGSIGVELRRTRAVELVELPFEIADAATDELVPGALVMTYRRPRLGDYSFHRAVDGRASPRVPDHPDTAFVLEAKGYRRLEVSLADVRAKASEGRVPRIGIERGLLRTLAVVRERSEGTSEPVAGVRVTSDGALVGTTDARGSVTLDLDAWPTGPLTLRAPDGTETNWEPSDGFADLAPAVVELPRDED